MKRENKTFDSAEDALASLPEWLRENHVVKRYEHWEWDDEELGLAFRERRVKIGISLREVARQAEISASFMSALECGDRDWSIDRIIQITAILDSYEDPSEDE